jgi:uncharacterized protein YndB with AHSA1/START domain
MVTLSMETEINGSAEAVFDAITDLRGYGRWLDTSSAYAGTTDISTDPIAAGTTYVEPSPSGVRRGTVTELTRPASVTFHQPMTMKPRLLGVIDIHVTYTLTPVAAGVHLGRTVDLVIGWPLRAAQPLVLRQFRAESERTMRALKTFVEADSQSRP